MKLTWAVIGAGIIAGAASAHAAFTNVVYSDDFSGAAGTVLAGKAVTVGSSAVALGGTAGATWSSDAAPVAGGNPDAVWTLSGSGTSTVGTPGTGADSNLITNAYLPFTPVSGVKYDLHLQMESDSTGASGNWLGLAFAQAGLNGHTSGGASSALSNDNPYGLIISKGTGVVQDFAGLGTANGSTGATVTAGQFSTFDVILDTTAASWSVNWLVNNASAGSFTYSTNPSIGQLIFGTNKLTGSVKEFSLTATPEPASLGLLAVGGLGLLARRRR